LTASSRNAGVDRIFTRDWDKPRGHLLSVYQDAGGYAALKKALSMTREAVMGEVKAGNLRGRGGAGFPAGVKWGFMAKDDGGPRYLCINADEGEPGTFKDRYIMERSPHLMLEGATITCFAINAHACYIYIRGEFFPAARCVREAIEEAVKAGYLGKNILGSGFDLDVHVHMGAGAYICGEESALIESIEGKPGKPRSRPPFPAVVGLFNRPTIVNNVETISAVPSIIEKGGAWYAGLGTPGNGGTKLYCVSGHVKKPGIFELPMGTSLREIIYTHAGGMRGAAPLKAVIPGGSSTPVLTPDEIDVKMDFDGLKSVGSMLGSAATIVFDDTACMVRSLARLAHFYAHESCGQCTPCREGTHWMAKIADRIENGKGRAGDIDLLDDVASSIMGNTICPLGDAAAMPVTGFLNKFRAEFEEHVTTGRCRFPRQALAPVKTDRAWV